MKKMLFLIIPLVLLALTVGCSSDDAMADSTGTEIGSGLSQLASAPTDLVGKDELPQWLSNKVTELETYAISTECVWQGSYNGTTVYIVSNMLSSLYGGYEFFKADGMSIQGEQDNVLEYGSGWKCIYYICKQETVGHTD